MTDKELIGIQGALHTAVEQLGNAVAKMHQAQIALNVATVAINEVWEKRNEND